MADYRMNYFWARLLAVLQFIIGVLMVIFGIVDRVENEFFTSMAVFGIWIGLWVIASGVLGILASCRKYEVPEQSLVGTHMAFSIASVVFAASIIISYSIVLATDVRRSNRCSWKHDWHYGSYYYYSVCPPTSVKAIRIGISVVMLLLGIAEFAVGIASAVLMCKACTCCNRTNQGPEQQVMYMRNMAGGNAGQLVMAQPAMIPNQQMASQASPMLVMAPGSSPNSTVLQGRPMVAITQPRGQPVVQGQPMIAVSQSPGQPVVQGQPMVALSQSPGQPVVQGQPMIALSQSPGQPIVQGQPMIAVSQSPGQPVVQGQPIVQGQPVVLVRQPHGQPVVQGQPVVVASQPSGQPVVQGQPVVVASQPSSQPVVQGRPAAAVIVGQQSGQPVVSMSQPSQVDGATDTQGQQQPEPELVNV